MKQIYSAGIIVYCYNDLQARYLLLQHSNGGHWGFAKGTIEFNETKHEAAARELYEETGLVVVLHDDFQETVSYFFTTPSGVQAHKTIFFFLGQASTHDVILSPEHYAYQWLSYEQALQLLTYEKDSILLQKAENVRLKSLEL